MLLDRPIAKFHDFPSCKNTKKYSNIFKRNPKKKFGPKFPKPAVKHVSYISVIHVITSTTFHNLSLPNVIAYNI